MMTVTLSAELEELVKAKVLSGQFNSSGEVIREGLRLLEEKDTLRQIKLDRLRKDLSIALEQVDRGEVAPLDIEAIIAEGHQRLAEQWPHQFPKVFVRNQVMTVQLVFVLILLVASPISQLWAAPPATKLRSDTSAGKPVPTNSTVFKYFFQSKGIDVQGHGTIFCRATKVQQLPDGHSIYDGDVVIEPKFKGGEVSLSIGPDVLLSDGSKVRQLKFGPFHMLFDVSSETVDLVGGVLVLRDGAGRSLTFFPRA